MPVVENLRIRTADKRAVQLDERAAFRTFRDGTLLNAHILRAVKYSSFHSSTSFFLFKVRMAGEHGVGIVALQLHQAQDNGVQEQQQALLK